MAVIGVNVYESSVGFYVCARKLSSTGDSIIKVLKLPTLNAFVLGCLFSFSGITLPDFLDDFIYNMRGAYSILGMVMVGLGLSTLKKFEIDVKFTLATLSAKFVFYPIAINLFIIIDKFITGWYDANYYNALQLLSTAPMAANIIVIGALHKFHPERIATAVLISLIIVLIYTPVMVSVFLSDLS